MKMQVDEHATVAFLDLCVCAWDVYQLLICGCVGLAPKMTHHQYLQPNHVFMIQIHTQQPTITWRPLKKSNSIGCTIIKYYKPSIWWYLHLWNPPIVNISRNTRSLLVKAEFPQDAGLHVERQLVGSDGMKQAREVVEMMGTEWKPI